MSTPIFNAPFVKGSPGILDNVVQTSKSAVLPSNVVRTFRCAIKAELKSYTTLLFAHDAP